MQAKPKRNSVVTTRLDEEGFLEIQVLGSGTIKFDVDKVDAALRAKAEMHGWTQRLVDAAAMSRDPENGQPATPAEKFAAIKSIAEYYMGGATDWARRSESGGGGQSITLQAVAKVRDITYEQAEEFVGRYAQSHYKGDMKAALAYLRTGAKVGAMILTIRAANAPKPVLEADDVLDELK